jgi:hypothetical protein
MDDGDDVIERDDGDDVHIHITLFCLVLWKQWLLFGQSFLVFCLCCRGVSVQEEGGFCEGNKNLLDFVPRRCTLIFSFLFDSRFGCGWKTCFQSKTYFCFSLGAWHSICCFLLLKMWVVLEKSSELSKYKIYWLLLLRASWDWIRWFCTQDLGGVGGEFLTSFQSS